MCVCGSVGRGRIDENQLTSGYNMQCNGAKPACVSCASTSLACSYTTPIAAKTKSGDLLVEAIQLLNTLTPSQTTATILSLRGTEDPATVINSLRHTAEAANQACSRLVPSSVRQPFLISNLGAGELGAGYTASPYGMQGKVRIFMQPMPCCTAIAFLLTGFAL
jgi:hypothetical protein